MDYSQFKKIEFRRKFFKFFGAEITITNPTDSKLIGFIKLKAFKLREDIRVYTDKTQSTELFKIHARNIIDLAATYDVTDSVTGKHLFAMRRKALLSMFVRDYWLVLGENDAQIGHIQETSSQLALIRRYLEMTPFVGFFIGIALAFIPQTYSLYLAGQDGQPLHVADLTHRKNPFIIKFELDTSLAKGKADARFAVAAVSLLSVVDASKN